MLCVCVKRQFFIWKNASTNHHFQSKEWPDSTCQTLMPWTYMASSFFLDKAENSAFLVASVQGHCSFCSGRHFQALLSKPKAHSCCDWKNPDNKFFLQNFKDTFQINFSTSKFSETKLHRQCHGSMWLNLLTAWLLFSDAVGSWRMLWIEWSTCTNHSSAAPQCCGYLWVPWSCYLRVLEVFQERYVIQIILV